jgi:hypothetical protein
MTFALVSAAFVSGAPDARAEIPRNTSVRLWNVEPDRATGKSRCLLVNGTGAGVRAELWNGCSGYLADDQVWALFRAGLPGQFILQNSRSGMCLEMPNTANNTIARQARCDSGKAAQRWEELPSGWGDPLVRIVSALSGKCLSGQDTSAYAEWAFQYSCLYDGSGRSPLDQAWYSMTWYES